MGLNVGIDFGTSNSGVGYSKDGQVSILPIDSRNLVPEVVKTILYITRDDKCYIGQEAVETYYRQNVNRKRRYVKKWVGEIEYRGSDMFYMTDVYAYVDELMPGRLLHPATEGPQSPTVPFLRRVRDPSGRLVHVIDAEMLVDTIYRLPELAHAGERARDADHD